MKMYTPRYRTLLRKLEVAMKAVDRKGRQLLDEELKELIPELPEVTEEDFEDASEALAESEEPLERAESTVGLDDTRSNRSHRSRRSTTSNSRRTCTMEQWRDYYLVNGRTPSQVNVELRRLGFNPCATVSPTEEPRERLKKSSRQNCRRNR